MQINPFEQKWIHKSSPVKLPVYLSNVLYRKITGPA